MACLRALHIEPVVARAHAERFSWRVCTEEFVRHHLPQHQTESVKIHAKVGVV